MDRFFAPRRLRSAVLVLAVAAPFLITGCSSVLDDDRLEQVIADGIETQTGLTVVTVDCPGDRPVAQGDVFECTAVVADGQRLTITVTQTDSTGNVNWAVTGQD